MGTEPFLEKLFSQGLVWKAEGEKTAGCKLSTPPQLTSPIDDKELLALPPGNIHEWFANKTPKNSPPLSILALLIERTIKANPSYSKKLILWIGKECWPTPYLLNHSKESDVITHSLFIDPPDREVLLWSIDAALRSPGVAAVIAPFSRLRFNLSQRFALAARQGGAIGLFVRPKKDLATPSAAMTRWQAEPVPSSTLNQRWKIELLKSKGAQLTTRSWEIEIGDKDYGEAFSMYIPTDLLSGQNTAKERKRA